MYLILNASLDAGIVPNLDCLKPFCLSNRTTDTTIIRFLFFPAICLNMCCIDDFCIRWSSLPGWYRNVDFRREASIG